MMAHNGGYLTVPPASLQEWLNISHSTYSPIGGVSLRYAIGFAETIAHRLQCCPSDSLLPANAGVCERNAGCTSAI